MRPGEAVKVLSDVPLGTFLEGAKREEPKRAARALDSLGRHGPFWSRLRHMTQINNPCPFIGLNGLAPLRVLQLEQAHTLFSGLFGPFS
jgi:hypothetical protein